MRTTKQLGELNRKQQRKGKEIDIAPQRAYSPISKSLEEVSKVLQCVQRSFCNQIPVDVICC